MDRRRQLACATGLGLALTAIGLAVPLNAGAASVASASFAPVADAYVGADKPSTNYGTATRLRVDGSPIVRSYLRFNPTGLTGTVTKATLRVYATSKSGKPVSVAGVASTTWGETTVTYANAPAVAATATSSAATVATGTWVSFDVTPLVRGDGAVSIAMRTSSSSAVAFASRESSGFAPQLVVQTDGTTATPPPSALTTPVATSPPAISGSAVVGQTLSTGTGSWSGGGTIGYGYSWSRCDSAGAACAPIAGAGSSSYALASADEGHTLRASVTATNSAGSGTSTSAPSGVVSAAPAPPPPAPSMDGTIRAAFYYPWFPEAWNQSGIYPFTKYHPTLGYYDGSDSSVIRAHITAMQYGKIQAAIASWWGQGTKTDSRIQLLLNAAAGTGFAWSLYYESESLGDPSVAQITSDLTYIRDRYASSPNYLRRNGKFVVFVYADAADGCGMVDRWKQANTVGAYLVLKVFAGYASCASQPDGWHQYSPAVAADSQAGRSYAISPGFDLAGQPTRLGRDLARWQQNVRDMVASNAPLQLVTTFNEWGEGTSVESATEWATSSGYGAYLDALHDDGVSGTTAPPPSAAPANSALPTVSGTATVGQALTATSGTWTGSGNAYAYGWKRCDSAGANCAAIAGATSSSYALVSADAGSTMRASVTATNSGGSATATSAATAVVSTPTPTPPPSAGDPVIAAAGDIACDPGDGNFSGSSIGTCQQRATSNLLLNSGLAGVLTLGDNQYEDNSYSKYLQSYDPSWGRVKPLIHPGIGNHEYLTAGAAGYFQYFGAAAGAASKGYYSFDIGSWHLIALNSNCSQVGGCGAGSPQESWLRADLAAHQSACTLAYWHHPRFSSGQHGSSSATQPLWQALYDANAEVVLNGHDHDYERFAPQTPTGAADAARGIRQFVVGTGGKNHYGVGSGIANSQVRNDTTYGVLKLTLHPGSYDWQFAPQAGASFTDSGSTACH